MWLSLFDDRIRLQQHFTSSESNIFTSSEINILLLSFYGEVEVIIKADEDALGDSIADA